MGNKFECQGLALKQFRKESGLTLSDVTDRLHHAPMWLSDIENGKKNIFFKDVKKSILNSMLGFGAGVMIAASFWSLLSPAIDLCDDLGKFAVEYDIDGGIKAYRFFKEWAEAKAFAAEVDEGSMPLLRKTTLEDVFLEITGRKTITNFVKVVRI